MEGITNQKLFLEWVALVDEGAMGKVVTLCFSVNGQLNVSMAIFREDTGDSTKTSDTILQLVVDLHQSLSSVSFFRNQNLLHVDCCSKFSFISYLDDWVMWTICCGAIQHIHCSTRIIFIIVGIYEFVSKPVGCHPLFPHVSS